MNIKVMTAADISAAVQVDEAAFSHTWDAEEFRAELAKDYAYYCIVERGGQACAYAGIWCVYETAELIRIAVHPDKQRQGIAAELMSEILKYAAEQGCEKMMLEVRAGNIAAHALYKGFGFKQIALRRAYYDGEDAVIMERIL